MSEQRPVRQNGILHGATGTVPGAMPVLRASDRFVARSCQRTSDACVIEKTRGGWDWLPPILLLSATLPFRDRLANWIFMWLFVTAMFAGCKWLTWRQARRTATTGSSTLRRLGYLFAWPGMDASTFLFHKYDAKPRVGEWLLAAGRFVVGVALVRLAADSTFTGQPVINAWVAMFGLVLMLHFGALHLAALAWRRAGVPANPLIPVQPGSESNAARQRMHLQRGEPLFLADWMRVLMLHFEVDADRLQRDVAYQLDLHKGRALVTLVAFTMENMRPRVGGKLGEWLVRPIASHSFLNVRTYVRHHGEPGIQFLAEWLSSWLAVRLGPRTFGLPYRHGWIRYDHDWERGALSGRVMDVGTRSWFRYQGETVPGAPLGHCEPGSPEHWLMERYTAFNSAGGRRKFFRVWHPPWRQVAVSVSVPEKSLLISSWPWFADARLVSCNFSPGLRGVWMGRPHSA